MSTPPDTFGKFQIVERISAGSMAEVYRARVDGINGFHRAYAIKRILPHLTRKPDFVEILIEEAKIAGLLSHANIVQIMDLGQVEDTYYIAMEFVDGPDMGRVMARCREKAISMPVPHAIFSCLEVLKGLEYAHGRQVLRGGELQPLEIVHRDVSPSNILLSFRGEIKLSDFGIAKASIRALETLPGLIKNRLHYASPEQVENQTLDQRADIFSMGVVLYEMLTSRHPFVGASEAATLRALQQGSYVAPSQVNPDIPRALDPIVAQALAVDRDSRFGTATEMKEALDQFFHQSGFIFSHSSMAAFLDGLFPDKKVDRKPLTPLELNMSVDRPAFISDRFTRPLDNTQDDPPTEVIQRGEPPDLELPEAEAPEEHTIRHRQPPSFLDEFQDISRSSALGPIAGEGDESTLIRKRPRPDAASAWGDAETLIKKRPPGISGPLPSPRPTIAPGADATTTDKRAQQRSRGKSVRRGPQLVYMIVGALVTGLVLAVGILLGTTITQDQLSKERKKTIKGSLEVTMPDSTRLELDDKEKDGDGRVRLNSNREHVVSVGLPDYNGDPVSLEFELGDFEVEVQVTALEPSADVPSSTELEEEDPGERKPRESD